jgi:hypothetical protein
LIKIEMIPISTIDVHRVYKAFEKMFVESYIQDNYFSLIIHDYNYEGLVNVEYDLI